MLREGKIVDRREMLRVKLKSLMEEARIIRAEERRQLQRHRHSTDLYVELHAHRTGTVRAEARATHIAYGLIRGRKLEQMERGKPGPYVMEKVNAMVKKYGPTTKKVMAVAA